MAYRPYEYVPQPYRPDDRQLTALTLAASQNEADRIRQQGVANAIMWRGIGNTASSMMSSLAQYKREAPLRAEEERKRKEADKLRGLNQLAGGYVDPVTGEHRGMTEAERGKLLRQEGFAEQGQEILDKDEIRQANKETREYQQRERNQKELSEIYNDLQNATPETYPSLLAGFETRYGKEKMSRLNLPPVYDAPKVKGLAESFGTAADELGRNNLALSKLQLAKARRVEEDDYVKDVKDAAALLYPMADDPTKWDNVRANIKSQIAHLPEDQQQRILAKIPYPEKYSSEALTRARELDPKRRDLTPGQMSLEGFRSSHEGRNPKTPAEIQSVIRAGTSGQGLLDPKDRITLEADARSDYDQSLKEGLDKFGRGTPEFNDYMKSVIDNYGARLAAINGSGGGYGGGYGGGTNAAGGWGSTAGAGGGAAAGGGTLAGAKTFQRPTDVPAAGAAPAAGGGQEASAAEIEAAMKAGGSPVTVNTPLGPKEFANQAVADLYLRSIDRGATGGRGSAAAPDYSQRPDVLMGGGGGSTGTGAAPDYSQRPDVLGNAPPAAPPDDIKRMGDIPADIANWWNQPRPDWRKDPRGLPPPAPPAPPAPAAPNTWTNAVGRLQQGPPPPSVAGSMQPPFGGPTQTVWPQGGLGGQPPEIAPTQGPPIVRTQSDMLRDDKSALRSDIPLSEPPVQLPPEATQGMLSDAAGPLRAPVARPQSSRDVLGAVKTPVAGTPMKNLPLLDPDRPDSQTGLTPRQVIEQMQPKVNEDTPMATRINMLEKMMFMAGYEMVPIEKRRTAGRQAKKKAQGYSKKSGLPGDESPHQPGQAADYIFVGRDGKRLAQDTKGLPWELYGIAAEKLGLRWGGRWKDPYDPAHVELPELVGPLPAEEQGNFRPPLPYYPEDQEQ